MNESDSSAFGRAMARLFAIYGEKLTANVIDAWWGVLAPSYPLDDVLEAMNRHAADPEAGMYRPTPAHVIKHLTSSIPRDRAIQHARRRSEFLAAERLIHDRREHAANDLRLGVISEEEAAERQREAREAIAALVRDKRYSGIKSLVELLPQSASETPAGEAAKA